MGAEQSLNQGALRKRSRSLDRADGSQSPQLSIASDIDVPYASSTINRPIGDSPKRPSTLLSRARGATDLVNLKATKAQRRRTTHFPEQITIVNNDSDDPGSVRQDVEEELQRFEDIPQFLPILRGALKGTSFLARSRDDSLSMDKIDYIPLLRISRSCQEFMTHAALVSGSEQNRVNAKMREVAVRTENLMGFLAERQRRYSKYAEGMSHVHEISRTLRKCQAALTEVWSLMDALNDVLPPEEQLEPFKWDGG